MSTAVRDIYTREMYRKTGLFAAWLPSTPVALGDVGVLQRNVFRKVTTLADLGVVFAVGRPGRPADLDYTTAECVSVAAAASADTAAAGPSAGLKVSFSRAGAVLFQAKNAVVQAVENLPGLEEPLHDLRRAKRWRPEYVIVTSLVRTGPTAIVISDEHGAVMELRADAAALAGAMPVASALGGLTVDSRKGVTVGVLNPKGATPLFGVSQLRRKPWTRSALVFRDDDEETTPAPAPYELATAGWAEDGEDE